ncbi:hypothetical protein, partial [Isoptericola haloaureus]
SPSLYDEETAEIVATLFAEDFETFGYRPVEAGRGELGGWVGNARPYLAAIPEIADRHERIAVLHRSAHRRRRSSEGDSPTESDSAAEGSPLRGPEPTDVTSPTEPAPDAGDGTPDTVTDP